MNATHSKTPLFQKSLITLSVLAVLYPKPALAEESNTLSPMVVTATSTPQTAAESLASVTVIDTETVKAEQAQELTEILAAQPGVDVSSNGGYGKTTSVYMRGANAESTKLLIDGIAIHSATAGGAPFENINPDLVDRIEIVRGPKATLYGADAVGGVIQVFLPEGEDTAKADISVGGGSFGTYHMNTTVSGGDDQTNALMSIGTFHTAGTMVKEGSDDKGYVNENVLFHGSHEFDNGNGIKALYLNSEGKNEYVGDETDYRVQVAGAGGHVMVNEDWKSELVLSETLNQSETVSTGDTFDTTTDTARWSNTLWAGEHEFVLGGEWSEDRVDVSAYDAPNRDNQAAFAQALLDFGRTSVQLNARYDDNSAYGTSTTGGVALGYQLDDIHTLRTSYGTAFEAPTFNDLYYPYSGDPTLKATESTVVEVGIRADYGKAYWDAAVFDADYGNMVIWSNYTGSWYAYNVNAKVQGLELASGVDLDQWSFNTAFTWLDAVDDETGFQLPKRAKHSVRVSADRHFEKGLIGATVVAANGRAATLGLDETLPGYATLNVRARYDFAEHWNAEVSVKNLFDQTYQTAKGYYNPGRGAFLTVNYAAF